MEPISWSAFGLYNGGLFACQEGKKRKRKKKMSILEREEEDTRNGTAIERGKTEPGTGAGRDRRRFSTLRSRSVSILRSAAVSGGRCRRGRVFHWLSIGGATECWPGRYNTADWAVIYPTGTGSTRRFPLSRHLFPIFGPNESVPSISIPPSRSETRKKIISVSMMTRC